MNRNKRKLMGAETVEIVDRGWYETADGIRVEIAEQVDACLNSTQLYTPTELTVLLASESTGTYGTVFEVENETTLTAARRHVVERGDTKTLCLNFASAKNPGGGFLGGSQAQEESLARSSALYASLLTQNGYYDANRACRTALYTDHMILSPNVPVFRRDNGNLLSEPYLVSILTAPAVNAGAVKQIQPEKTPEIRPTMAARIERVLAVADSRGYEHLILGAWGCGVFRNNPSEIAELFADSLLDGGRFCNQFASVTFAVSDSTANEKIISPFKRRFAKEAVL